MKLFFVGKDAHGKLMAGHLNAAFPHPVTTETASEADIIVCLSRDEMLHALSSHQNKIFVIFVYSTLEDPSYGLPLFTDNCYWADLDDMIRLVEAKTMDEYLGWKDQQKAAVGSEPVETSMIP